MPKIPEHIIDAASERVDVAFAVCGLVSGGALVCPECGTAKKKKVVLRPRYWKCHRCGSWGSAIRLVQDRLGVGFADAVRILVGDKEAAAPSGVDVSEIPVSAANPSVCDPDVYRAVVELGDRDLAARFYARFGIDPDVTREAGASYLDDPKRVWAELVSSFGEDRLEACGVATRRDDGTLRPLFGARYPVVEPAVDPNLATRNLQFRASVRQKLLVDAHKRGMGPYVPPFLSVRGAGERHLIGIGLERLARLKPTTVYVVEGFKDLLAVRTLGFEGYALPGVSVLPPAGVVRWLAKTGHTFCVALDGDEAGQEATPVVADHLRSGIPSGRVRSARLPDGMDWADLLREKAEAAG